MILGNFILSIFILVFYIYENNELMIIYLSLQGIQYSEIQQNLHVAPKVTLLTVVKKRHFHKLKLEDMLFVIVKKLDE